MDQGAPTSPATLSIELRYALRHWHDDTALSESNLATRLEAGSGATVIRTAEAVRNLVRNALVALKPTPQAEPPRPHDSAWKDAAWQDYLLLTAPFVLDRKEQVAAPSVTQLFAVSQSTFYRRQEAALTRLENQVAEALAAISRTTMPLTHSVLTTPPAPSKYFIAREDVLRSVQQRVKRTIQEQDARDIIVIHGLPGMGKTALLAEIAQRREITAQFGGVLWMSLGSDYARDMSSRLLAWASALGMNENEVRALRSNSECQRAIAQRLNTRRMLVLLDDVWSQADAELLLGALGSNCMTVITTRFPRLATDLGLRGEAVMQLSELNPKQSLELLKAYAPDAVQKFPELAEQLNAQLNGWPIALRLAGEQLRRAAGSQQYRRIKQAFDNLITSQPHSEPLAAMIAASDHSAFGQRLLQQLSTLLPKPVSFTESFVVGLSDLSEGETLTVLDELVDVGLVESVFERGHMQSGGGVADRYVVHPVIADYARAQLIKDSEVWSVMVTYIKTQCQKYMTDYVALDQIIDHIRHALGVAQERGMHLDYAQIVAIITPYLFTRSQTDWLTRVATQALASAHVVQNRALIAAHHSTLGQLALRAQDMDAARNHLEQALIHADSDDVAGYSQRATIYETQANAATQRKDKGEAARMLALAIRAAQVAKKISVVPRLMMQLDQLTRVSEPMAHQEAQTAVQLWVQGGRVFLSGQVAEGERLLIQSVEIARRIDARSQLVTSLGMLATVAAMNGNAMLVEQCADEGIRLIERIVYPRTLSWLYASPALMRLFRGDVDGATKAIALGLDEAQRVGLSETTSWLWYARSLIGLHTSNLALAYSAAHEAVALGRKAEHVDELPHPLAVLGYLAAKRGEFQEAQVIFADAQALCQPIETSVSQTIMVKAMQGEALYLEGRYDAALQVLLPISQLGRDVAPNYFPLLRTEWTLAKIYAAQGSRDKAIQQGLEAQRRYSVAGNVEAEAIAVWLQGLD